MKTAFLLTAILCLASLASAQRIQPPYNVYVEHGTTSVDEQVATALAPKINAMQQFNVVPSINNADIQVTVLCAQDTVNKDMTACAMSVKYWYGYIPWPIGTTITLDKTQDAAVDSLFKAFSNSITQDAIVAAAGHCTAIIKAIRQ
jgi:hypothetical protein